MSVQTCNGCITIEKLSQVVTVRTHHAILNKGSDRNTYINMKTFIKLNVYTIILSGMYNILIYVHMSCILHAHGHEKPIAKSYNV